MHKQVEYSSRGTQLTAVYEKLANSYVDFLRHFLVNFVKLKPIKLLLSNVFAAE